MKSRHALHADYSKFPSLNIKPRPIVLRLLNVLTRWDRRRRCAQPLAGVRRETINIPNGEGGSFPAIVSRPQGIADGAPLLLYYHGGAFCGTYSGLHMQFCERYARDAGCIVVMPEYRLAPEHLCPKGFDDCYTALKWVHANAASLGGDAGRIAVMGDSAGGALAAGVAQKAVDHKIPLRAQLLIYPVLDHECKTFSATDFHDVPMFNTYGNRSMWAMYLGDAGSAAPEYASPAQRKDLRGLPRTLIDTAEFDPLRDEDIAYAQALTAQGVEVTLNQTKGTIHGFELMGRNPESVRSIDGRIAFLKTIFT